MLKLSVAIFDLSVPTEKLFFVLWVLAFVLSVYGLEAVDLLSLNIGENVTIVGLLVALGLLAVRVGTEVDVIGIDVVEFLEEGRLVYCRLLAVVLVVDLLPFNEVFFGTVVEDSCVVGNRDVVDEKSVLDIGDVVMVWDPSIVVVYVVDWVPVDDDDAKVGVSFELERVEDEVDDPGSKRFTFKLIWIVHM